MWAALLGASGYVPLPLSGADYTALLPVRFHPVTGRGIRINYRTYDHAILNEHRGRPCSTGPGGKWEVHLNPHDVRQIYLRLPDGHLHEIPWIHRDHVHAPMSETTWRHIRTTLEQRAEREAHEAALAETADQILRHTRPTTPAPPAVPATAPGTRAGKAASQAAGGEPAAPHRTAAQAATGGPTNGSSPPSARRCAAAAAARRAPSTACSPSSTRSSRTGTAPARCRRRRTTPPAWTSWPSSTTGAWPGPN
ncbi:hypothetical protein [Streptomyces sp. NPDC029674]|uniref:hypothetical protein n=1 Tax=Streptomyces sp. NPDC029674 TaxID=3365297 RepID=UPI00384EC967